jgi:hypothetical protein
MPSSPQVLHYENQENYPKNPLQRMKPSRPLKNGMGMILRALKDLSRQVTRVILANVLDERLKIGGRGRRMNSKVNIRQTRQGLVCIENKCGTQLAQSQSVPGRPLLAPLYRWPGLEEPVRFNTNYNVYIRWHLIFRLHLCLGLPNGPQGYQDNVPY